MRAAAILHEARNMMGRGPGMTAEAAVARAAAAEGAGKGTAMQYLAISALALPTGTDLRVVVSYAHLLAVSHGA